MKIVSDKRAIDKIYRRRDRYEIPDWQRDKVWSRAQKQRLVDSILRGWKLPKFYFLKLEDDEIWVVDGQQRLAAIWEFFSNELPLSKESADEFKAEYYRDLPTSRADLFDDFEIEFDEIEDADEKELKEFFQRLQGGMPLTSSEKLNSVHSKLRDFAKNLSAHTFFKRKVSASDKRYGHFDIASKTSAIEIEGLNAGLRYAELKKVFDGHANFSANSNVGKRISAAFDYLDRVFDEEHSPLLRNRTVVQSFVTLACRLVESGKFSGTEKRLKKFFGHFMAELSRQVELGQKATDPDYLKFQKTVNANVRTGVSIRHTILLRKLLVYDPKFADLFDPSVVMSGVTQQIKDVGERITNLVGVLNTAYAGKNGEDLIKMTNKTSQALARLGKSIKDLNGYKSFIDDLYFLFHEGPSNRLSTKPATFLDINALRTDLRHDVDHGKRGKVMAKRKWNAEVFAKYAGDGTPDTVSPEKFITVQASLLTAIESDLSGLVLKANS